AVAHWLEQRHGQAGRYDRIEALSVIYQQERGEYEEGDAVRVLFRALLKLTKGKAPDEPVELAPKDIAKAMCDIAEAEDLAEQDRHFTTARRVGWLMKRQRFRRPEERDRKSKLWLVTRAEVESGARAQGVAPDAPRPP